MTTGKTLQDVIDRELRNDPEFRREWERTRIAREVAIRVVTYRATRHLTQDELGAKLGLKQPAVARLETGEHLPSVLMLGRLAERLGMEFHIRDHEFSVVTPTEETATAV